MLSFKSSAIFTGAVLLAVSCSRTPEKQLTLSGLDPAKFEATVDGKPTALYTLTNEQGMEVCITNFGGRVVSVTVPDRQGTNQDVVLGFDSIGAYLPETNSSDFGAAIGRYANRIAFGKFVLDGDTVSLPVNNFGHTLHGGPTGWQYKVYDVVASNDSTLELVMNSPAGDNGFPGSMTAKVTYTLDDSNSLNIKYEAITDAPTVVNLTNHSYFNLSGNPEAPVTDHILTLAAESYTPVDSTYMTTGEIASVENTPMDFRSPKAIGAEIDSIGFEQLRFGNGYDHNFVLDSVRGAGAPAATLYCPASGIRMMVFTDEPGIQFYSGNFLDGSLTGKKGIAYGKRAGVCLETQHYPDSPNKADWPSVVLRPGETYTSSCTYRFDVAD